MEPPKKPWELESAVEEIPPRPTAPVDTLNTASFNRPHSTMGYASSPYGNNSAYGGYGTGYNTGYGSGYGGYGSGYGGYGSGAGGYGSGVGGYGSYGYNNFGGYNSGYNRPLDSNSLGSRMEQETQQTFATIQQIVQVQSIFS